ncbi:MAG TPA: hypothetical protein VH142_15050 [Polyangiaceae bacterium]|jgi:hypothetical protein|nr:hypothetical protein [Polyangiaceae bacterium]
MKARLVSLVVLLPLVASLGCGGDNSTAPSNVQGNFTVAVTNGTDSCGFATWTDGQSSSNIPVAVTQNGNSATATVTGLQGTFLDTVLGSNVFTGAVEGAELVLALHGTRSFTQGACAYTIVATLKATADGDVLRGTIDYAPDTNSSADCASLATCGAHQDFNGTRPPATN